MDSTSIAVIQQNTVATLALTGSLWVFMGVTIALVCGYLAIRYTLRG